MPRMSERADNGASHGVELMARAGYTSKGVVYALVGALAVQQAVGNGGSTTGTQGALRSIADAPWGTALLAVVTLGLVGYVGWRWVQAFMDAEGGPSDDGDAKRWLKRAFYFGSGVVYGILAYYGARLTLGSGGGGGSGAGARGDGGGSSTWVAQLMELTWGQWLVGAVGVGIVARGLVQFAKAYTQSFKEDIQPDDLSRAQRKWVLTASRVGLTARGVIFGIIGGSVVNAAVTHDPRQARGLEGALDYLGTSPWLLGSIGVGLVAYGIYQWVKARYRLIAT